MNKKNLKKRLLTGLAAVTKKSAELSANDLCIWWQYQPKMPASVKKMRKF